MRQNRSTLRLMLYGVLAGLLDMIIWIEILNRWHLSKNLYLIYAGLLGMGGVYGAVGSAVFCGLLHLFEKVRAQFGKAGKIRRPSSGGLIAVTNHSGLTTASTANAKANRSVIDDLSQLSKVSTKN
jgi:hypothetical protein